jgi:hypothetical protein
MQSRRSFISGAAGVFTTLEEIDRFTDALIDIAENGLPS